MNKPLVLTWGGNFKSITDEGILEGKAIVFGSETSPDISSFKDFFTEDTFIHPDDSFTTPLFYEHALSYDEPIGKAIVFKTNTGWEATAELDMQNPIVMNKFKEIKAGGWGFSSGALGHTVKRERKENGTHHVTQWNVGELSITKTPAEPKALIYNVKSIEDYYNFTYINTEEKDSLMNKKDEILMSVVEMLIEQINQKHINEFLVPEIDFIKSQLEELKNGTSITNEDENEELTVLKSENLELKTKLEELQSSFIEIEALLSEKMALLSDTQAELEVKSQEKATLEEALLNREIDIEDLEKKIKTLNTANIALAKTNFKL